MLKIVTAPNPVLTTPTKPVNKIDKKIERLVAEMEDVLVKQTDPQGVGLAATQVGISLSLFIVKHRSNTETRVFINPKILQTSSDSDVIQGRSKMTTPESRLRAPFAEVATEAEQGYDGQADSGQARMTKHDKTLKELKKEGGEKMEGCLSVSKIWAPLKRRKKVQIEFQDLTGKKHKEWFSGLNAVIVQHEVDHLQGVLFTQRCIEQNVPMYEEKGDKLIRIKNV